MEAKTQDDVIPGNENYDLTLSSLLTVLQSEEADLLDKVLLEMLTEDVNVFVERGK